MGWADDDDFTPQQIRQAMNRRDFNEVRRLFAERPEFLRRPDGSDTWLSSAAYDGDIQLLSILVGLGLGLNESNDAKVVKCAIDTAAGAGHLEAVRWLLDNGADVNHVDNGRVDSPALTYAAYRGHLDIVKLLVERGADIHSSWCCMNALMHAQDYGQHAVVQYLRSLGVRDLRETTPPDYPLAHRRILEHFIARRGAPSGWRQVIAGDPLIELVHIDSSSELGDQSIFTVGLSDRRLPTDWGEFACAELFLTLPPDWQLIGDESNRSKWTWPIRGIERIARDIRECHRWPAAPVLFPNEQLLPFDASTKLCCWLCAVSQGSSIQIPDCRWVDFHALFAIYAEEMQLVQEKGQEALFVRFQARELSTFIDPNRPNVAWDPEPEV